MIVRENVKPPPPPPPPTPLYILRSHTAQISSLTFSRNNRYLYSGDIEGYVAVWELNTFRPKFFWKAHGYEDANVTKASEQNNGILNILEFRDGILTHARDNKIHYYPLHPSTTTTISPGPSPSHLLQAKLNTPQAQNANQGLESENTASSSSLSTLNIDIESTVIRSINPQSFGAAPSPTSTLAPSSTSFQTPDWSLDVNAMGYCKMSLLKFKGSQIRLLTTEIEPHLNETAPNRKQKKKEEGEDLREGLVAVPSLTKDDEIDIFHLPTLTRVHRSIAISNVSNIPVSSPAFAESNKTGTVMSLKLFLSRTSDTPLFGNSHDPPSNSGDGKEEEKRDQAEVESMGVLSLLAGYEDGRVVFYQYKPTMKSKGIGNHTGSQSLKTEESEGLRPSPVLGIGKGAKTNHKTPFTKPAEGWELVWEEKGHREAVMSIDLSPDGGQAWSVSADHYICHYHLLSANDKSVLVPSPSTSSLPHQDQVPVDADRPEQPHKRVKMTRVETTAPGRAEIKIRDDGKLVGVAGWDGEARLYSSRTGEPLAVLSYHRTGLHAIAFASISGDSPDVVPGHLGLDDDDGEGENDELDDDSGDSDGEEMEYGQAQSVFYNPSKSKSANTPTSSEENPRRRKRGGWMATGGHDEKISLWEIYPPK